MKTKVYSVTEITQQIKKALELSYSKVLIQGEISNLTFAASGHCYFNLKDERAQISAALFKFSANKVLVKIENGMEIIATGKISVYEPRGSYQLLVTQIHPVGLGSLQIRFEEMKQKLQQEGLFALEHKKPLPIFPKKIAIITSLQGAAIQDILTILRRRAPHVEILLLPSLVQGEKAAEQLVAALGKLEQRKDLDLVLITRGGGSMEDLWCFNEEILIRKIFACQLPVVSAVGHESDFTLVDFVADKRVATPSEAAETITPDRIDLLQRLDDYYQNLIVWINNQLQNYNQKIQNSLLKLKEPTFLIKGYNQKLEGLIFRLVADFSNQLNSQKHQLEQLQLKLYQAPILSKISFIKEQLLNSFQKLKNFIDSYLKTQQNSFLEISANFQQFNPLLALDKGYSQISNKKGEVVKSIFEVREQEILEIKMRDGSVTTQVKEIKLKLKG